jgi:hypothetical protein
MHNKSMKLALTIGLAVTLLSAAPTIIKRAVSPQCENPGAWYTSYNETYFNNALPKDTVVDYANHTNGVLAATTSQNGHLRISFNREYASSALVVQVFMLHEMCHVETWDEIDEHGVRWIGCMRRLEAAGAIDDQMVKPYEQLNPPTSGPKESFDGR